MFSLQDILSKLRPEKWSSKEGVKKFPANLLFVILVFSYQRASFEHLERY